MKENAQVFVTNSFTYLVIAFSCVHKIYVLVTTEDYDSVIERYCLHKNKVFNADVCKFLSFCGKHRN